MDGDPLVPSIQTSAVTVTTSATLLCDGVSRRRNLTLTNNGAVSVYLGGGAVTSTAFFRVLSPGDTMEFTRGDGGDDPLPEAKWYGVAASSSASVSVGEIIA